MVTGENFKRIDGRAEIKKLKSKIIDLKTECGKLQNVNEVRENGFDEEQYYRLSKEIEWNEYLLWGLIQN